MALAFASRIGFTVKAAAGLGALALIAATPTFSQGTQEVIVTITQVRAIDKIDAASKPDFLARVTIAGQSTSTPAIKDQELIRPNWVVRQRVSPGIHNVKLEILDKDVTKNDSVDVNRVDGKRDLDFQIDTTNCAVLGFSQPYRCGSVIQRAGAEKKAAEVTFSVTVGR